MPAVLLGMSPLKATRSSNLQPGLPTNHWYGCGGQVSPDLAALKLPVGATSQSPAPGAATEGTLRLPCSKGASRQGEPQGLLRRGRGTGGAKVS